MEVRVPITFVPAQATVWVHVGTTVAAAARLAGVLVATPCGGRGACGSCGVRVLAGALAPADEFEVAGLKRAPDGVRLACRARVAGAVSVRPLVAYSTAASSDTVAAPGGRLVAGVDLGTTSVAALLVEADSGREIARASVPNRQGVLGADVLSRMGVAIEGGGAELRRLAEQSIVEALELAASLADADMASVERLVIAGNTVMVALLLEADVAQLSVHPFAIPELSDTLPPDSPVRAALPATAEIALVPPIAAFVGGDALAATVAAGMADAEEPILLVDLGTNAEIVLASRGPLMTTSTAAGPAFEGVGVSCGGPAAVGAVDLVHIEGDEVTLRVMGGGEPGWLSGSGLVSVVAALRRNGAIGPDGRLLRSENSQREFADSAGVGWYRLGPKDGSGGELAISQLDLRTFQLAKAAVRVGIQAVLAHAGVRAEDLSEIVVAGAFGSALRVVDLVEIGLLPAAVQNRTRVAGNAALEGAAAIALDADLMPLAVRVAREASHVDLAAEVGFGAAFVAATQLDVWNG